MRLDARDGEPDTMDCGGELLDWAAVDIDAEASITGCAEIVSLSSRPTEATRGRRPAGLAPPLDQPSQMRSVVQA